MCNILKSHLKLFKNFSFINLLMKSFVFDTVCCNFPSGDNKRVPIFEITGHKVNLSTPFPSLRLQNLIVP